MKPVFEKDNYRYMLYKNPLRIPSLFLTDLKFCGQRIRRGFCDRDLYDIGDWFLDLAPEMLSQFKKQRHGSPGCLGENHPNEKGIMVNETCHAEWDDILDKMIFLLRESRETTCQRKNPYEDEHAKIFEEFSSKYGLLGEKLCFPEESKGKFRTMHFPSELPEYQEIEEKYMEEERKLEEYRNACKDEALALFSKWIFNLWD